MVDMNRMAPVLACDIIVIVAVALRFWCKHITKAGYHGDDWWTLTTVLSYIGAEAALLWGVIKGNRDGATIGEINEQLQVTEDPEIAARLQTFLKSIYVALTISFFVVFAVKIAILLLYRTIFSTPAYKLASNILIGISVAWFIAIEVTNVVHCWPIHTFWTDYDKGSCLNFNIFFLIGGIVEVIIDAAILVLPMVGTYRLHTNLRTKLLVSGIFLVGGFSVITNILRVYYTYQPEGRFVNLRDSELWTIIHIASATLCACLPVYKPLQKPLRAVSITFHNLLSSSRQYVSSRSIKSSQNESISYPMDSVGIDGQAPQLHKPSSRSQESTRDLLHTPS